MSNRRPSRLDILTYQSLSPEVPAYSLAAQSIETSADVEMKEQLKRKAQDSLEGTISDSLVSWYRGDRIGRGAHGTVYVAINLHNWELMAVKQVENSTLSKMQGADKNAAHEMEILKGLTHPHIVTFKGSID
jgi:Protein kinase domain